MESLETRALLTAIAWSEGPVLPAPRTDAVAVVTPDSSVRLLGGNAAAATDAPLLPAGAAAWTTGQAIDTQRNDLGAVSLGSSVLLFGGTGNDEGSDEVLNYDYRAGDSQDLAKMNQIRFDHAFARDASGGVYAFGGIGVLADGDIWSESERYDAATDSWSTISPLPQALHGMSAMSDGEGHIFVFGGSSTVDDSGIQNTTYRYDVASDTWSTAGPMPIGTRDSAVAKDSHGMIYITGGVASTGATAAVQQYDPSTNTWSSQTPLPQAIYSHASAFDSEGRVLVIGGFDATGTATDAVFVTQDLTVSDSAPVITTVPNTQGSLDSFYSYDVNASGNPIPAFRLATKPAGMEIDPATGVISWQPTAGQVGSHTVVVEAFNRAGVVQQSFIVDVVADTIAPTTPGNFTFDSATEASVAFRWDAASDAGGIDHYEIATAVQAGNRFHKYWSYTVVASVPAAELSGVVSGLSPLESHSYAVRAVDTSSLVSAWSARVNATTLGAPTLAFRYGTQASGAIQVREQTPISIQLVSQANPAPSFEMLSGPAGILVDSATGLVSWTPDTPDVGNQAAVFRASNSVGSSDLTINFDVLPDTPKLTVQFNPQTGESFATAGRLFEAQVLDSSTFPSTFELLSGPVGMTMNGDGLISWTPTADQGGANIVSVRGTNAGGSTDLTFPVTTAFTGAVSNVVVTGETTQVSPTVTWDPPTGVGAELVTSYNIRAYTRYHWGSHTYSYRTHTMDYVAAAGSETVDLTGLLTGKTYTITITPVNASGILGVPDSSATVVTAPDLPSVQWTVNGQAGTPANVVAGQPLQIVLTDYTTDPSDMELISGPASLTFDPTSNTADWTPSAADVNVGYTTTDVVFRVTNSVGPVDVTVPIHVMFSGSVTGAAAFRNGYTARATWNAPTDNVTPVASYQLTRYWTFAGSHKASASYTIPGSATSFDFSLSPTGAVNHTGITIVPIDAAGNYGVATQKIAFGAFQNDLPAIANDDAYDALEDLPLAVSYASGVLANDVDTDNTPGVSVLQARLVSPPAHGLLSLASNGSFTYTPTENFNGTDIFVYRVYDGKFYSGNATVAIQVAAVNDAPVALDDNYSVNQDSSLGVVASAGVLANDFDVDADLLSAAIVAAPAHGTLTLSPDGSFSYTPEAGYAGLDTFTYIVSDGLADSRIATVNMDVQAAMLATKFFVVDTDVESTFEYSADGTLLDNYALSGRNRGAQGVAATSDGSVVYVANGNLKVYVYDNAGAELGVWQAVGPERVDGIATDDNDIWLLDRRLDMVFRYAGGAALRSGEVAATDSFALHSNNRNGKGLTTDGTHIWVVNDVGGLDKVYKYTVGGAYVGRWNIDPVNASPTGITIDPTGASENVWIVDNSTDSVFQYNGGAIRTSGSALADSEFLLDAGNTNPQGIADPASFDLNSSSSRPSLGSMQGAYWQNPVNPLDANGDGSVSSIDALQVLNYLNSDHRDLRLSRDSQPIGMIDVNGDGWASPVDVLSIVNALNRVGEGERLAVQSVDLALDSLLEEDDEQAEWQGLL